MMDVQLNGLFVQPPPPFAQSTCSEWSVLLGHFADVETNGASFPNPSLLTALCTTNTTTITGLPVSTAIATAATLDRAPVLQMEAFRVRDALCSSRLHPPEVQLVKKAIPAMLRPFHQETAHLAQDLAGPEKIAFLSQRKKLRRAFLRSIQEWSRQAVGSCAFPQRTWEGTDTLLGPVRTNRNLVWFPLDTVAPGPRAELTNATTKAAASDSFMTQLHSSDPVVANMDFDAPAEPAQSSSLLLEANGDSVAMEIDDHSSLNVALSSAWTLLLAFSQDMQNYYAGDFNTLHKRKKKRGRGFGTTAHPLYERFLSAACGRVDEMSVLDTQEMAIFEQQLWLQAEEAAVAAAAAAAPKIVQRLVFRERNLRNSNDVVPASNQRESFCNVVLLIMQHPSWSITSSGAMLRTALAAAGKDQQQQQQDTLQLVHQCLTAWVAAVVVREGTHYCLPVLRSKSSTRGLFQNTAEFWRFSV
jgi:hypothetical protein